MLNTSLVLLLPKLKRLPIYAGIILAFNVKPRKSHVFGSKTFVFFEYSRFP